MSKFTPATGEKRIIEVDNIHDNSGTDIIMITTEKMQLILVESKNSFRAKDSWIAPLGVFLTIVLVLLTADFKSKFGFQPEFWSAIFWISAAISLFATIYLYLKRGKIEIEDIMERIKTKK